jgi:hypothetical protein
MKQKTRSFATAALMCWSAVAAAQVASAQSAPPEFLRVVYSTLAPDGLYGYQEAQGIVNEGFKKSGTPWREVWASSLFGEMRVYVSVVPLAGLAQFDKPGPLTHLTEAQRMKYQTLLRGSVRSSRAVLLQLVQPLSILGGRAKPAGLARVMNVRVQPGKQLEFEEMVRTMVLPAYKKAGAKELLVHRALLGTALGEYTIVQPFENWAEMAAFPAAEKLYGPEGYKQWLARVAATVASGENMAATLVPALGYSPQ